MESVCGKQGLEAIILNSWRCELLTMHEGVDKSLPWHPCFSGHHCIHYCKDNGGHTRDIFKPSDLMGQCYLNWVLPDSVSLVLHLCLFLGWNLKQHAPPVISTPILLHPVMSPLCGRFIATVPYEGWGSSGLVHLTQKNWAQQQDTERNRRGASALLLSTSLCPVVALNLSVLYQKLSELFRH